MRSICGNARPLLICAKINPMYKEILRISRIVFGILLVLIGIVGVFMPILPGWILIFVGIELVGIQLVFLDKIKKYVKTKIGGVTKKKE